MGDHNAAARRALLKQGKALPGKDGGPPRFPIADKADLAKAVTLHGQVPPSEQPKVKRHILKHARRLNAMAVIPDSWNTAPGSGSAS